MLFIALPSAKMGAVTLLRRDAKPNGFGSALALQFAVGSGQAARPLGGRGKGLDAGLRRFFPGRGGRAAIDGAGLGTGHAYGPGRQDGLGRAQGRALGLQAAGDV